MLYYDEREDSGRNTSLHFLLCHDSPIREGPGITTRGWQREECERRREHRSKPAASSHTIQTVQQLNRDEQDGEFWTGGLYVAVMGSLSCRFTLILPTPCVGPVVAQDGLWQLFSM